MRLIDAARYFNDIPCVDAYDAGGTAFLGALVLYDEGRKDGPSNARRVLQVAPGTVLPARLAISALGQNWTLGQAFPDAFKGVALRDKYVIQEAPYLATVTTIPGALGGTGTPTFCDKIWVKDVKEVDVSANLYGRYHFFLAAGESVARGAMILAAGMWHLVQNVFMGEAGIQVVVADELPAPVLETVTWNAMTLDPVAETRSSTATTVNVLRLRHQSYSEYDSQADFKYVPGDYVVVVLKSVGVVKAGDTVALTDGTWNILSVIDKGTVWMCHARHA